MNESDLERHARILAEFARGARSREEILAAHGLDEAGFSALDVRAQAELERAADDLEDGEIPASISAYGAAWQNARRALGPTSSSLTLDRYAEATVSIQKYGDPTVALAKVGLTLGDFLRATEHWTRIMAEDSSALRRFTEILKSGVVPPPAPSKLEAAEQPSKRTNS